MFFLDFAGLIFLFVEDKVTLMIQIECHLSLKGPFSVTKKYEIRDPIYGFIELDSWERDIINHPAFQRLRRIRQLALD
jgi:hypothetical protein